MSARALLTVASCVWALPPPNGEKPGYALNGPFGRWQTPCFGCLLADYDLDRDVDLFDFGELQNHRSMTTPLRVYFQPLPVSWRSFVICMYGPGIDVGPVCVSAFGAASRDGSVALKDFAVLANRSSVP